MWRSTSSLCCTAGSRTSWQTTPEEALQKASKETGHLRRIQRWWMHYLLRCSTWPYIPALWTQCELWGMCGCFEVAIRQVPMVQGCFVVESHPEEIRCCLMSDPHKAVCCIWLLMATKLLPNDLIEPSGPFNWYKSATSIASGDCQTSCIVCPKVCKPEMLLCRIF